MKFNNKDCKPEQYVQIMFVVKLQYDLQIIQSG